MTCGSAREAVLDLARGVALADSVRLAVETHVHTCPACAADLEHHRALTAALQALSAEAQAWSASPEIERRLQAAFEARAHGECAPVRVGAADRALGLRTGHGRRRRARGVDRQPRAASAGRPRDGGSALPGGGTGKRTAARVGTGSRGSTSDGTAGGQHIAASRGRKSRRPRGFDRSSSSRFRAPWDYPTSRAAASSGSRCRWRRCRDTASTSCRMCRRRPWRRTCWSGRMASPAPSAW